jgi:hypothetical protein
MRKGDSVLDSRKVSVSIYCLVHPIGFSREMLSKQATGQEIYDFLMKDAGLIKEDGKEIIPGDLNLWYLGSTGYPAFLRYQYAILDWDFGESSFERVQTFVTMLYLDSLITDEQYQTLLSRIEEGKEFDCIYDLKDYLIAKREGKQWVKTDQSETFRKEMKKYVNRIRKYFDSEGMIFHRHLTPN